MLPLLCLCRAFCVFEICLDSNPESCRSKQARYQLSHSSLTLNIFTSLDPNESGSNPYPDPLTTLFVSVFNLEIHFKFATSILFAASHFAQYGIVATSNVSRAVHNTMKKNFGFVNFKVTICFISLLAKKASWAFYTINKSLLWWRNQFWKFSSSKYASDIILCKVMMFVFM